MKYIKAKMTEQGISLDTVKKVKKSVGVISRKEDGVWWWKLPETGAF